jgi:drug/metabolite transporter (DMT)-like permease
MLLLIAAFNDAFGIIVDKIVLAKAKVPVPIFTAIQFFFLTSLSALTLPFLGIIDLAAWTPKYLGLLIFMIGLAVLWNLFYYLAIQKEPIENLEVILLTQPLVTVVISAVFFADERHSQTLVAAFVASVTLIVSHLNRQKLGFDRYELVLLFGILLMAIEAMVIKSLVQIWSPAALYTVRTLGVFLIMLIAIRPTVESIEAPVMILIFLTGISGVIFKIIQFTSYADYGIVFTTLILILSPVFVLMLDKILLHEKVHLKQMVAMIVIIAAVAYGTITR